MQRLNLLNLSGWYGSHFNDFLVVWQRELVAEVAAALSENLQKKPLLTSFLSVITASSQRLVGVVVVQIDIYVCVWGFPHFLCYNRSILSIFYFFQWFCRRISTLPLIILFIGIVICSQGREWYYNRVALGIYTRPSTQRETGSAHMTGHQTLSCYFTYDGQLSQRMRCSRELLLIMMMVMMCLPMVHTRNVYKSFRREQGISS